MSMLNAAIVLRSICKRAGLTTGFLALCLLWLESIKSDLSLSCPTAIFWYQNTPPTASDPQKLREQKISEIKGPN